MPARSPSIFAFYACVSATPSRWTINCRSPHSARTYSFGCEDCAAEFARALRGEGEWSLRFGPGCDGVAAVVAELDQACAA